MELTRQKMETKTVFIRNLATDEQGFINKFPFWHQTKSIKAQDKNKNIKGRLTLYSYINLKKKLLQYFFQSLSWMNLHQIWNGGYLADTNCDNCWNQLMGADIVVVKIYTHRKEESPLT